MPGRASLPLYLPSQRRGRGPIVPKGRCSRAGRGLAAAQSPGEGPWGEGGYLVGVQLPAGDYVAQPQDLAPLSSYSVYTGILGTDAQLTQFQLLHEATPLTLKDGDYVELSGCSIIPEEQ